VIDRTRYSLPYWRALNPLYKVIQWYSLELDRMGRSVNLSYGNRVRGEQIFSLFCRKRTKGERMRELHTKTDEHERERHMRYGLA